MTSPFSEIMLSVPGKKAHHHPFRGTRQERELPGVHLEEHARGLLCQEHDMRALVPSYSVGMSKKPPKIAVRICPWYQWAEQWD
jgi:hypothetical protein